MSEVPLCVFEIGKEALTRLNQVMSLKVCVMVSAVILCTGGRDVIRKEAWHFYRTSSGVRLCWELVEPKGSKGVGYESEGVARPAGAGPKPSDHSPSDS